MARIQIAGGRVLEGSVEISGAKNAVLPILMAALLTEEPCRLEGVPHLKDVTTTMELLGQMGVSIALGDRLSVELDASAMDSDVAPYDLVKTMRASILVLGPLLARRGVAQVSLPGGCAIGARPVDLHLKGLGGDGRGHHRRVGLHPGPCTAPQGRADRARYRHGHGHREPDDGRHPG